MYFARHDVSTTLEMTRVRFFLARINAALFKRDAAFFAVKSVSF